jgi:uncharacterized membrane protein YcaP (DUF421 family)
MDSILRAAAVYLFVWMIFRLAGKRTLSEITTFDAVLLLIVSETTQGGLVDNDNSLTNSILLILTFLGLDVALSYVKLRFPHVERIMDGAPLVIFDANGFRREAMQKERVSKDDVLHAARDLQGLSSMDQIEYAVLEQTGDVTIVPKHA